MRHWLVGCIVSAAAIAAHTELTLERLPGEHTLQLLCLDDRHLSFEPTVASEPITLHLE